MSINSHETSAVEPQGQSLAALPSAEEPERTVVEEASSVVRIALPTRDGSAIAISMLTLAMVGVELQRPLVPMIGITTAPSRSRNRVMEFARAADPTHIASWILWLDSDIEVHPDMAPVIARYIREAEQRGQGWSAAYRMSDGRSVLMDAEGDHLTDQEWRHLPDWSPLHWPILGLAYWRTPLDYTFRSSYLGEDILLKEDLGAGAQLHFARGIHVRHFKGVWLEGPRLTVRRGRGDA